MEPLHQHIINIDEIELYLRIDAGERSSGNDRPVITMEERFRNLKENGEKMRALEASGANRPPAKIQKVIFLLRDHKHFDKYFELRVTLLGPIHHGKTKYKLGEKYKHKLAYEFIQGCGKSINRLYEEAEMEIKQLRKCFEEEVMNKYDDEAFAWMLFVDGCAILQYIFCAANSDKFNESNIKNDNVTFALQDLFLLENQIPYRLLNLLMGLSGNQDVLRMSIESFIWNISYLQMGLQQKKKKKKTEREVPIEREPTLLLDLLRTTLLGPPQPLKPTSPRRRLCPWRKTREEDPDWKLYRNLQQLKASEIRLKRSKNSYLREISFSRRFGFYLGYLCLPSITLDDSTGPKFMNLIPYKMCLDFENDFAITSYISFLDSLIDEANDVKDLREAQILHNFFGRDKEVADLFYEIGTDLVPSAYKDVKFQIQEYYNNSLLIWIAELFHDYFSSPWSIITFVVTIVLSLCLSITQAWYAAHPPPGPSMTSARNHHERIGTKNLFLFIPSASTI